MLIQTYQTARLVHNGLSAAAVQRHFAATTAAGCPAQATKVGSPERGQHGAPECEARRSSAAARRFAGPDLLQQIKEAGPLQHCLSIPPGESSAYSHAKPSSCAQMVFGAAVPGVSIFTGIRALGPLFAQHQQERPGRAVLARLPAQRPPHPAPK